MEYRGKLYGKIGGMYFDTSKTSEDWDNLENKVDELQEVVNKNCTIPGVMPRKLTAENGAKALLCGEFNETVLIPNEEYCGCGECDFCDEFPDTEEYLVQKVPIPWTTIKEIYDKIVAFYGA